MSQQYKFKKLKLSQYQSAREQDGKVAGNVFFMCFSNIEKTVNETIPSVGALPSSSADIAIEGNIIL